MTNSLDPDQGRHSVGPDLGPDYLHRLTADDKSSRQQGIERSKKLTLFSLYSL